MRKLQQTIVTLAAVVAPFIAAPIASAATCANGYTGPDSNNLCTSTTTYSCTVTNNNTAVITNDNTQVALSGNASSGGNTGSGSALSGSATNSNGVTFNVVVTNSNPEEQGVCVATATVPATPTPTPTPVATTTPATAVAAPKATTPQSLANTSSDSMKAYLIGSVVALAAAFGLSRVALSAYTYFKS